MDKPDKKLMSLESLMPSLAKRLGIDARLKEMMIMNYWQEIARGEMGKDSKPYSITTTRKGLTLNIAVKSAMVAQELTMIKMVLLDKINSLASQVGLTIDDIVFSSRYWGEVSHKESEEIHDKKIQDKPVFIDNEKLKDITLSDDKKQEIEAALDRLNIDSDVKLRIKKEMERELKLIIYKQQRGFPVCQGCGVFLNRFSDQYCPACKFQ